MIYKVFFAWQSELDDTQGYIKNHLRKAASLFSKDGDQLDIIFYPAQNMAGSPSIPNLIIEQIKQSDVFIADLSTVAKLESGKELSNANVMYELGVARAYLGENRIIILVDKEFTIVEKLAFDVNHSRITSFERNKENFYKDLYTYIKKAIEYANNQKNILDYSMNEILSDLLIVYNNCFRLLRGYEEVIEIKEVSKAFIKRISNKIFLDIQIHNNFAPMLFNMKQNMKQIVGSNNFEQSYKIKLVELIKTIEHFCFVFQKNRESFFAEVTGEEIINCLMDSCGTFLKVAVSDDEIDKSIFFRDNTYLFSYISKGIVICDCFDKRNIEKYLSKVQEVDIRMDDGLVTKIKDHKYITCETFYSLNEGSEKVFTELLVKILLLIHDIIKEIGLVITMEEDGKKQNYFSFHRNK